MRTDERASRSERPSARSTWLGRPEPLAQALPSEKAMSRKFAINRDYWMEWIVGLAIVTGADPDEHAEDMPRP